MRLKVSSSFNKQLPTRKTKENSGNGLIKSKLEQVN